MIVASIVGARPQFIKAAVVSRALRDAGVTEVLIHTGQHYDDTMSDIFFRQLGIADPDYHLGVGSGSHGEQTARMLAGVERVLQDVHPDRVLVYGDTNSTLAGALAAAKLALPVDHVEAGLRSFDRDMPEEVNRVLVDHVADQLFCPTRTAIDNLAREGITAGVQFTGDVMLDLAIHTRAAALEHPLPEGIHAGRYFLATVHRAANTDDATRLVQIMRSLAEVATRVAPVIVPAHPRLVGRLATLGVATDGLRCIEPVGYLEMQGLILRARGVITDSGGVQKEALFHGVPCLTLRDTTEWIEGVEAGQNALVGTDLSVLADMATACGGRTDVSDAVLQAFGGGCAAGRLAQAVRDAGGARCRWRAASTGLRS